MVAALCMAFFQALGVASIIPFMSLLMRPEAVYDNRWVFWLYNWLGFTSVDSFVFFMGFVMLGIIVVGNLISALAIWLKLRFVWRNNHKLATALLRKYLSMPYVYFLNHHSADLGKNVLAEVNNLTSNFLIPFLEIVIHGTVVVLMVGMLFFVNPIVSSFALVALGGSYALIYLRFRRKLQDGGKKRLQANRGRFKAANEALAGIKDIKVLGRESFFIDRFITHSRRLSTLQAWNAVVGAIPRYLLEIIAFGGIIVLILVMMSAEGNVHHVIPMVSFFAFAGYRLLPSLQHIFQSFTKVQFNRAVLNKIYNDMIEEGEVHIELADTILPKSLSFQKYICLDHISFWYPNTREPVLKSINLEIKRHTSVAIAGPTGSGKTTMVDIFLGLLFPQQGKLLVDGVEITADNVQNWQRNLGYVPQQIYLSDDTIARNIAFSLPDKEIDRESLDNAALIANLHDFIINELPNGYDTLVGERGVRLSGGQRQRVGIARALYHDPEILVLDEATSSLDGITEDAVLEAMDNASKVKTLVVIAHRLTTVKNCDVIYLIDRGSILTSGTYSELLSTSAQFRAMAKTVS